MSNQETIPIPRAALTAAARALATRYDPERVRLDTEMMAYVALEAAMPEIIAAITIAVTPE